MKKILIFSTVAVCAVFLSIQQADALKLTPTIKEFSVRPGDAVSGVVQLLNDSSESQTFVVDAVDAKSSAKEDGFAEYSQRNETSTLSNWIGIRDVRLTIAPGETKGIQYVIAIP